MIFFRKVKGFGWCLRLWIDQCSYDPPEHCGHDPDYFFDSTAIHHINEYKEGLDEIWDNGTSGLKYVLENCRDWISTSNSDHIHQISFSRQYFLDEDIASKAGTALDHFLKFQKSLADFTAAMNRVEHKRCERDKWLINDNQLDFDSNMKAYSAAGIKLNSDGNPVVPNDDPAAFYYIRNYFLKHGIEVDGEGNLVD